MASKPDMGKSCPTEYSDIRQQCRRHVCILQKSEPHLYMGKRLSELFWADEGNEKWLEELVHQVFFPLHGTDTQLHGNSTHAPGIIGLRRSWESGTQVICCCMDLLTITLLPNKTGPQEQERVLQPHDHT